MLHAIFKFIKFPSASTAEGNQTSEKHLKKKTRRGEGGGGKNFFFGANKKKVKLVKGGYERSIA